MVAASRGNQLRPEWMPLSREGTTSSISTGPAFNPSFTPSSTTAWIDRLPLLTKVRPKPPFTPSDKGTRHVRRISISLGFGKRKKSTSHSERRTAFHAGMPHRNFTLINAGPTQSRLASDKMNIRCPKAKPVRCFRTKNACRSAGTSWLAISKRFLLRKFHVLNDLAQGLVARHTFQLRLGLQYQPMPQHRICRFLHVIGKNIVAAVNGCHCF